MPEIEISSTSFVLPRHKYSCKRLENQRFMEILVKEPLPRGFIGNITFEIDMKNIGLENSTTVTTHIRDPITNYGIYL
jgi:hypothetical protein